MNEDNAKLVSKLVRMAAYLLEHPDLPNALIASQMDRIDFFGHGMTPAEVIHKFGSMEKVIDKSFPTLFILRKQVGDFTIEFNFKREEVCKKVLKEVKVLPAEPARTVEIEATPERTEEVWDWECPDSILRPKADDDVLAAIEEAVGASLPATDPVTL